MRLKWLKCRILQNLPVTQSSFGKIAKFTGHQYPKLGQLGIKGIYDIEIGPELSIRFMATGKKHDNRLVWQGYPYREPYTKWIWMQLVRRTKMVAEVGSGYGEFTLAGLAANPSAVVHAFELSEAKINALDKSASLNPGFKKRLFIHPVSADDERRKAAYESAFNAIHQASPLANEPLWSEEEEEDSEFEEELPVIYNLTLPEVIKLEPAMVSVSALHGLVNAFPGYKPVIIAGITDYESFVLVRKWVVENGYRWYQLNEELRKFDSIPYFRHKLGPNFIFYPKIRAPLVNSVIEAQLFAQSIL